MMMMMMMMMIKGCHGTAASVIGRRQAVRGQSSGAFADMAWTRRVGMTGRGTVIGGEGVNGRAGCW